MRKASAARKIQTSYRRYRTTSAGSKSALSRVIRSYNYSHPYQVQPSEGRTCTFWRTAYVSIPITQNGGFTNGLLFDPNVNWCFELQRVIGYLGGVATYFLTINNYTEFTSLFDYYKINAVKLQMFYSANVHDFTTPGTTLPMFHIANDFDDAQNVETVPKILERVGVRTVQFDATNQNGIRHYVKPKPALFSSNIDGSGVQGSSVANIPFRDSWFDTASSQIPHYAIKMVYNNQGRTGSSDLGTVTLFFNVEYQFKGYK